jgi:hypothetical protein
MKSISGYEKFAIFIDNEATVEAYVKDAPAVFGGPASTKLQKWMDGEERLEFWYPLDEGNADPVMKPGYLGKFLGPKARVFQG